MQNARIEKPEKVSFHLVRLQANWFINIDSRKFIFTDCQWATHDDNWLKPVVELKKLNERKILNANALLRKASWQLADNYEENKDFMLASVFRQMANESKRLEEYGGYKFWRLHWWYWLSSFYGESWKRAVTILLIILFGFALIYTQTDFQVCPNNRPVSMSIAECDNTPVNCRCKNGGLRINEAIAHSIATALFQNVEYRKPFTIWGELTIYLEKILAPLQAALLALAIRRKFMR